MRIGDAAPQQPPQIRRSTTRTDAEDAGLDRVPPDQKSVVVLRLMIVSHRVDDGNVTMPCETGLELVLRFREPRGYEVRPSFRTTILQWMAVVRHTTAVPGLPSPSRTEGPR